ncbi:hypothetical protein [Streptomyces sp. NBC_00063]|uniref:hypothetical protein n=1 Tax=Streptomyces sp. NBC_00063 TaxID=2975638 RepID=UPI003D70E91F
MDHKLRLGVPVGREARPRSLVEFRRLLLPGEVAGVGFGEDAEFDQAFQLGSGAFDVLRQRFVVEGFADVFGR